MKQYTAFYAVSDFFYRQDVVELNISNHRPIRQIQIKTHKQLYENIFSNISTIN